MHYLLPLLAQISDEKLQSHGGAPLINADYSYVWAWVVAGLAATGILLVTLKTSKRNHMERE